MSRKRLSIYQFYETIQIEYICALLRAKIYVRPKDKDYWNKVVEGKRLKIEDISSRNNDIPSIFTDSDLYTTLERKVYCENRYPIFVYRDEENKKNQEFYDLLNYFSKGVEVRYNIDNTQCLGVIKKYKPYNMKVVVEQLDTKEEKELDILGDCVVRIL